MTSKKEENTSITQLLQTMGNKPLPKDFHQTLMHRIQTTKQEPETEIIYKKTWMKVVAASLLVGTIGIPIILQQSEWTLDKKKHQLEKVEGMQQSNIPIEDKNEIEDFNIVQDEKSDEKIVSNTQKTIESPNSIQKKVEIKKTEEKVSGFKQNKANEEVVVPNAASLRSALPASFSMSILEDVPKEQKTILFSWEIVSKNPQETIEAIEQFTDDHQLIRLKKKEEEGVMIKIPVIDNIEALKIIIENTNATVTMVPHKKMQTSLAMWIFPEQD